MMIYGKPISAYGMYVAIFLFATALVFNMVITLMPNSPHNIIDYCVVGFIFIISCVFGYLISRFFTRIILTVGPPIITAFLVAIAF